MPIDARRRTPDRTLALTTGRRKRTRLLPSRPGESSVVLTPGIDDTGGAMAMQAEVDDAKTGQHPSGSNGPSSLRTRRSSILDQSKP